MSKVPKFIPNPAYKARPASSSKFSASRYVNEVGARTPFKGTGVRQVKYAPKPSLASRYGVGRANVNKGVKGKTRFAPVGSYYRVRGPLSTAQLARLHDQQLRSDNARVYGDAGGVEYAARDHDRFVRQQRY